MKNNPKEEIKYCESCEYESTLITPRQFKIGEICNKTIYQCNVCKNIEIHDLKASLYTRIKMKIYIPDTSKYVGNKTLQEVKDIIQKEYVDTGKYEFAKEDIDPELIPKDDNCYYLFGSCFRNTDGDWYAPNLCWGGGKLHRHGYWLDSDWFEFERVVLVKIENLSVKTCPLNFCSLISSNCKEYKLFGLTKDGKIYGRLKTKWEELK